MEYTRTYIHATKSDIYKDIKIESKDTRVLVNEHIVKLSSIDILVSLSL